MGIRNLCTTSSLKLGEYNPADTKEMERGSLFGGSLPCFKVYGVWSLYVLLNRDPNATGNRPQNCHLVHIAYQSPMGRHFAWGAQVSESLCTASKYLRTSVSHVWSNVIAHQPFGSRTSTDAEAKPR
jgi:hypothetical protein